jgi:UDP-3-O-[3-hydroxymyristoyl] glucosamine N-acyltransferase
MEHPGFFERSGPHRLTDVAKATEAELAPGTDGDRMVSDVRTLADAGAGQMTFCDNRKYLDQVPKVRAGACLISAEFAGRLPSSTVALVSKAPYRGFALALRLFYPDALFPKAARAGGTAAIDPTARLEPGVEIEPGAIIGPEAAIGSGTRIAANAVIGYRCMIGRDSYIGPGATLTHALVGNRVIIHAGVRIGQDGFGFAMGRQGHFKVPQIGRVIVQDDVEIGANTGIDRGALKDTVIGEGTKIDNLVQIGHNVVIGRHCIIVGQVGLAGSCELGDFVVIGGQAGVAGHLKVGPGAQIAGASHAKDNVPAGARMVGTPALPIKDWAREQGTLKKLAARGSGSGEANS